jgi:dTDP-4-dehydrorhamnose 3,5-epimerase
MRFTPLDIPGAYLIDVEPHRDDRGFFARTWCAREFAEHGLTARLAQCSVSFNEHAGTLRGLHYQAAPHEEAKLVRCTHGAIFDVLVDLRPASPSFKAWVGAELSAGNRRMMYVPEGVAHGFQTLERASEVLYLISEFYAPESARGVRWDDQAFNIAWPAAERRIVSDRDLAYPDFRP